MFIHILSDMNIAFSDLFIPYKFKHVNIDNKTILNLNFNEMTALVYAFFKLIVNNEYGKTISMKTFMKNNNFSESYYDYIER